MSVNDPIGDMLTRIRNAQMRNRSTVRSPASKLRARVLEVLKSEGYIRGYEEKRDARNLPEFEISLKYFDGMPVIKEIKRVSKPGRRVYSGVGDLPSVRQGLGVAIVSTPRGVMSDAQARADNVGGEVLCTVFEEGGMSRIGKRPVELPGGVTATVSGRTLEVKGPKGVRSFTATDDVEIAVEDGQVTIRPRGDSKRARQQWGMSRTQVQNCVTGVTEGFRKELEVQGVGYRAQVQGKTLKLALGLSHDVEFPIPEGIEIKCAKPTEIEVSGIDQQQVGQVASNIRDWRRPEPYKGKGIRYKGEYIFRKEGKKK